MSSSGKVRASAIGGQSGEIGSVYRSGVAAYLAAYALASEPAPHIGLDERPLDLRVINVESDEAVDDILCEMKVGALLIQAKRTCGLNLKFGSVVDQWVELIQEGRLQTGSRLILATGKATKVLHDLRQALERHRNPNAQQPSVREEKALKELISMVSDRLDKKQLADLLDAAMVIELPVEDQDDAPFREAARLLEGTVVRRGHGVATMQVLQHHFQGLGAKRWASDRDEWRRVIHDAGHELLKDHRGGWSAQQSALNHELDAYRAELSARLDVLPLNLVANDLPPMRVENLVRTYQVALPNGNKRLSYGLAEVWRRWGRVVVIGLPGSGKSMALEQLAATWAATDEAPVPILISLRTLLRSVEAKGETITLTALVAHAVNFVDQDSSTLIQELVKRCQRGEAALLFDGLDECRDKAGWVSDAIMEVVKRLHVETSVILTTRRDALPAASKLGIPEVELIEPYGLESTLEELLEHVALHRVAEPKRRTWLKERSRQLDEVRRETSELLHVPLMAVLLTLQIAADHAPVAGGGRGKLLMDVITDSVKRWGANKPELSPPNAGLSAEMVLDAFGEIGRALSDSETTDRERAEEIVAAHFETNWGLAKRPAVEAAQAAIYFWDDRAGVFVQQQGVIEPRSRVFVEIAEAMWADRLEEAALRDWLMDAIVETNRHDTVLLAAGLRPKVAELIIEAAVASGKPEILAVASEATSASKSVKLPAQQILLKLIEARLSETAAHEVPDAAQSTGKSELDLITRNININQTKRDGPIWPTARRLAQLPLDTSLWERRDRLIGQLATREQRILGDALSAVSQVTARGGGPSEDESQRMLSLLQEPTPELESRTRRISRRHLTLDGPTWVPLSGFDEALVGCLQSLPAIDSNLAKEVLRTAQHTSFGTSIKVEALLAQGGHNSMIEEMNQERMQSLGGLIGDDHLEPMRPYYELVATAVPPSKLTLSTAWRLETLSTLTALLHIPDVMTVVLEQAFSHASADMEFLIHEYTMRAGLDAKVLASEARIAAAAHDGGGARKTVHLLFVPQSPASPTTLQPTPIEGEVRDRLLKILQCGIELPFALAIDVLAKATDTDLSNAVLKQLEKVPPRHRNRAARLVVFRANNWEDAVLDLLTRDDGVVHVAAAGMLGEVHSDTNSNGLLQDAIAGAASSRDYAVRAALLNRLRPEVSDTERRRLVELSRTEPEYWTCCSCGDEQVLSNLDCADCPTGTRPDLPEPMREQLDWYNHPSRN